MYYPSSENKGTDQLRSNHEADLRLCFRLSRLFSHEAAQIIWTKDADLAHFHQIQFQVDFLVLYRK